MAKATPDTGAVAKRAGDAAAERATTAAQNRATSVTAECATTAAQERATTAAQNHATSAAQAGAINPPFDRLTGQPLVARFLTSVIESRLISHAYLFVGPIGAGKNEAAREFAKALACREGGCQSCDDCIRISRGTHPDVKIIEPGGAHGYLSEQIHALIHDANLAPIRAQTKIYLIARADLLHGAPANAFLKTLEEPPTRVIFILLARTRESVLDTISSRCQCVTFRSVPEVEAVALLMEKNAIPLKEARIALATTGGSAYRAREYLGSGARRDARVKTLEIVEHLKDADSLEILESARELLVFFKQPLDEVKVEQERQLAESRDYLSKGALTALEQRQKRALTSRERESLDEALNAMRSWLRDCLLVHIGRGDDLVNSDFEYNITKIAQQLSIPALIRAFRAVDKAEHQIHYNVSVQSAIEALLFTIRDELVSRN